MSRPASNTTTSQLPGRTALRCPRGVCARGAPRPPIHGDGWSFAFACVGRDGRVRSIDGGPRAATSLISFFSQGKTKGSGRKRCPNQHNKSPSFMWSPLQHPGPRVYSIVTTPSPVVMRCEVSVSPVTVDGAGQPTHRTDMELETERSDMRKDGRTGMSWGLLSVFWKIDSIYIFNPLTVHYVH